MPITKTLYGETANNESVNKFVLSNENNVEVHIIEYGACVTNIIVPDKTNKPTDVVLGYDTLSGYEKGSASHGAFVGRVANRIKNSCFEVDGKKYDLTPNVGKNHLHGTLSAYVFSGEIKGESLVLKGISKSSDEGYPGDLDITITYTLTNENAIVMDYIAHTTAPTILNLTNHAYFNLNGHDSGDVHGHTLFIDADKYTPSDEEACTTGEIDSVFNTPMDFTKEKEIGADINEDFAQLIMSKGYDHNYVLNKSEGELALFARATGEKSKIAMEMYTTQPGVQFYTGNHLENDKNKLGKNGAIYKKRSGFCMETQHFPCASYHSHFPSIELFPENEYHHTSVYKFLF